MSNDITALAQRIPERKRHDWSQSVMRDCDFCNQWALTVKHEDGARICASCCDAEYTSKLEVANTALVEALEKAQAINAAAEKLVRCKGRYHSEQNYRALATLFGVNTPDLPPLDGESRAVTVKLPAMNDDLIAILGRPNFMCAHLAELLRKSGEDIKRKSEHEQAAVIHWFLGLYLEHGEKWESVAKSDIQRRAAGIGIQVIEGEE